MGLRWGSRVWRRQIIYLYLFTLSYCGIFPQFRATFGEWPGPFGPYFSALKATIRHVPHMPQLWFLKLDRAGARETHYRAHPFIIHFALNLKYNLKNSETLFSDAAVNIFRWIFKWGPLLKRVKLRLEEVKCGKIPFLADLPGAYGNSGMARPARASSRLPFRKCAFPVGADLSTSSFLPSRDLSGDILRSTRHRHLIATSSLM